METQNKQVRNMKIIKYMTLLTSIILVVTFIMSIYFSAQITTTNKSSGRFLAPQQHYSALFIGNEANFIASIKEGIEQEAERMDVAIEFHVVSDVDEATEIINLLVRAGVDGIITQGINNAEFLEALKSVSNAKIPLVLMYTDLSSAERDAFVGINPFDMGLRAANLTLEANPKSGKVVFISQSSDYVNDNPTSKMHILGFLDGLESKYSPESILMKQSQPTLLSAEGLVSELFISEKDIVAIVCTNETDTIGVAQVVIDLNRVGKTTIIGTGLTKEIADYIDKGIVYGTLFRNPVQIGVSAMSTLLSLPTSESYVEIPIEIVTKENLDDYRKWIGGTP